MSTTRQSPTNASELIQDIGASDDEGVQVLLYPEEIREMRLGEGFPWAPGVQGFPVYVTCGDWGERLADVVTDPPTRIKWWRVRDTAKALKKDLVPVNWQGCIQDIPLKYFSDSNLGIRFFNDGPWFWPIRNTHLEANLEVIRGFLGENNGPV